MKYILLLLVVAMIGCTKEYSCESGCAVKLMLPIRQLEWDTTLYGVYHDTSDIRIWSVPIPRQTLLLDSVRLGSWVTQSGVGTFDRYDCLSFNGLVGQSQMFTYEHFIETPAVWLPVEFASYFAGTDPVPVVYLAQSGSPEPDSIHIKVIYYLKQPI